jgi:RND family efflux transporter MFP subunit
MTEIEPKKPGGVLRKGTAALATVLAIALAVGAVAAGTGVIAARAAVDPEIAGDPPLSVRAEPLTRADTYRVTSLYEGRIEARRQLSIGFELGGTIVDVLVEEGDRVKAGDVLARLDTRGLEADRAAQVAARDALAAQLELAELTTERQKALLDRDHASSQRHDEARLQAAALAADLRRAEAGVDAVDIALSKATLVAPFDAVVAARVLDEGARAAPGQGALTLLENHVPEFRLGLPDQVARRLAPGASVDVTIAGTHLPATIARIAPELDPATRTVAVLLRLDGADGLPEGALGTVALEREVAGSGAWVPVAALSEGLRGLWTLFIVEDGTDGPIARREAVELLHVDGEHAFVRGAFAEDARIVGAGAHRITDGQRVRLLAAGG